MQIKKYVSDEINSRALNIRRGESLKYVREARNARSVLPHLGSLLKILLCKLQTLNQRSIVLKLVL